MRKAATGICLVAGMASVSVLTALAGTPKDCPEITIRTERLEQVIGVEGDNREAKRFLEGYELVDPDLDDVLEDLIRKMMREGYFETGNGKHAVITVRDAQASEKTLEELNRGLETYLRKQEETAAVLREYLEKREKQPNYDGRLSRERWDIIERLLRDSKEVTSEEMEKIGIGDLLVYAEACGISTERMEDRLEEVRDRYRDDRHLKELENRMDQINEKYDADEADDWDDIYDDDRYDDDRYDDDRYDDERDDDDRHDDDRDNDNRYDDERDDDERDDDDRHDDDHHDDDRDDDRFDND